MELRSNAIIFVSLSFFLITSGCANTPPPMVLSNDSSAIAISVYIECMTSPLMIEKVRPNNIFFIKLNRVDDSLQKRDVFASNFIYKPIMHPFQSHTVDSFAMNVEPGVYAAVGAICTGYTSNTNFLIFFPKEMIASTVTEVYPDTMAYMGKYILSRMNFVEMMTTPNRDEVQTFYFDDNIFDLVMLEDGKSVGWKFHKRLRMMASLSETMRTNSTEISFLEEHFKTFKGTEWSSKLKNQLVMLKNNL